MSKKKEEVEIRIEVKEPELEPPEPTLEHQYQDWVGRLTYEERHKILKKQSRPKIRDEDLQLRLEFLKRHGVIMSHVVEKALVEHFTDLFELPPKKLAYVISESKRKEIRKVLGSYYDHTGIKKSLDKALVLNWKDVTKHWNKLHKMLLSGIEQIRAGAALDDVTKPISKITSEFFSDDWDAHDATLVIRLLKLKEDSSRDFQKFIDLADDLSIAGNIASKIEELTVEYRTSAKGFSL